MYIEHICFNLALAIIVTLFIDQKHAGWCTAVIVVSGCMPDIDGIFSLIQSPPTFTNGIIPSMAFHFRYFHSICSLLLYAVVVAGLLAYYHRHDFRIMTLFAGIGFSAHLLEDVFVYKSSSAVFWPVS
ncbi:MAG: metal-dependent hydrolase, partial [Methanoregula sp.]|nr:metal-dependent hydrolase [Methanoregula sp.]